MISRIFILGLVTLPWATAAAAQPTASNATSSPSPAAEQVEAGANVFQNSITKFSVGMDCAQLKSVQQGFQKEADAFQRLSDGFAKIGKALTLVTAGAQAAQGKFVDATQTMGEAVLDEQVCLIVGTAGCVGWTVGRTAGGIIKQQPWPGDPQGRTIEDVVTDKEVEWLLPYLDQPMNVENMQATFAAFQSKQADLKRRRQEAEQRGGQCKAEEAKNAIAAAVAKAKADLGQKMTSDASDADIVSDTTAASRGAAAAQQRSSAALYESQSRSMSQSMAPASSGNIGGSSPEGCAAARAQIAEYDKWLAQMASRRNESSEVTGIYASVEDARQQMINLTQQNCH